MPQTIQFPAFLQLQYDGNGASAKFERDIRSMTQSAETNFKASATAIDRALDQALSRPRNLEGALDLGVPQLREAAQAAKLRAAAAEEMSRAVRSAALAEGDFSQASRLSQAAANSLAVEQREAARAAMSQAAAAEQVQAQLNKQAQATTQLSITTRNSSLAMTTGANSLGAQRFAMIQVGQQLQDITVGFASGQRAATIFAQQLPQLGFALTGFNGKLGALGRLLAGPAGVAIFAAVTVASFALTKAFESNADSASESERAQRSLTEVLNDAKSSYEEVTKALKEYNSEQESSRAITIGVLQDEAKAIESRLKLALATKRLLLSQIELNYENSRGVIAGPGGEYNDSAISENFGLTERITELNKEISDLEESSKNAVIGVADEIAKINSDPSYKITLGFDELRKDARESINDVNDLAKAITRLNGQEKIALDAVRASTRSSSTKLTPVTLSEVKAILERELGAVVGSTTRTKAQNDAVGGSATSFHLFGQALDLPFSKGRNAQITKDDIRRVLVEEGIAVEELLGRGDKDHDDHNHVAFSRRRRSPEQLANSANKEAERAAAAAARETSRLASLSDQAAESIARVNEQYDEQPRLVDRAAQSTRKLDGIIAELSDPKNAGTPRLKELIAEAQEARAVAANAVNTEISRYSEENEKNLEIMSLQAAGLFDQAEILQEINRLDERLGLTSNLEKQREIAIEASNILEDETATTVEREKATKALEDSAAAIAKINGQQSKIRTEAENYVAQQKELTQLTRRQTDALNDQLQVAGSIRQSLTGLLTGTTSGGDFLKDLRATFAELQGKRLFDAVFGDAFDQIEAQLNGDTPLGKANSRLVKEVDQTAQSANSVSKSFDYVADAANAAAAKLHGITSPVPIGTPGAANDNRIIEVDGIRKAIAIDVRSISQLSDEMAAGIVGPLAGSLDEIFGTRFSQQLSGALSSALSGFLQGGEVGGALGALRGGVFEFGPDVFGKGMTDKLLNGLDGALGGAQTGTQMAGIAKALGLGGSFSTTGSQIGGAIGSVVPIPGGEIIGSVIGGLIGGLLKKTEKGYARASISESGELDYELAKISGKGRSDTATSQANALFDGLKSISDQLGGALKGGFTLGSIGTYKDKYSFDPTFGSSSDTQYFASAEEAIRAGMIDAINRGVISGISASEQNLLKAGSDLESAVQDALTFQNVFTRLKAYKDPVGAALDNLDREFDALVKLFEKAGASAQEYAELEELYGIERAQAVKEASERITGSLRDLFRDLTIGDSGLSLRTRLGNAQGEYDPLAARVAAGDITAYDDYAEAARTLLDLQREVYGSSEEYFRLLDEVTQLTKTRIDEESNIASLAVDRDTPFSVDQTPVVDAISFQNGLIQYQTDLLASYLAAISKNGGVAYDGGGGAGNREPVPVSVANF